MVPGARESRPRKRRGSIVLKILAVVGVSASAAALISWWGTGLGLNGLLIVPTAIAYSILIAALVSTSISESLKQATTAARAMARGNYSVRVVASTRDEVGELAEAFNLMARDLAEVERMNRDVLANVSHELRTPVAALRALLENMADGVEPPDPHNLQSAVRHIEHLTELLQTLLDLSRLDAGVAGLDLEDVRVAELVDDAIETTRLAAAELGRDVNFATQIEPADVTLRGDRVRLGQVLVNVLDNAARHAPPGSTVELTVSATRQQVRIDISDQGPGIDPADRDLVFRRFHRGTPAGAPSTGGTGIGLSIARWAVTIHGGRIFVADSPVGATFRIVLPVMGPQVGVDGSRENPARASTG